MLEIPADATSSHQHDAEDGYRYIYRLGDGTNISRNHEIINAVSPSGLHGGIVDSC